MNRIFYRNSYLYEIFYYWIPVLCWGYLIFFLSSEPVNFYPDVRIPYADKLIHLFLYSIFSWLIIRALGADYFSLGSQRQIMLNVFAFSSTLCYGILDEVHQQLFVLTRGFEVSDMVFDAIGAIVGIIVYNSISDKKVWYSIRSDKENK